MHLDERRVGPFQIIAAAKPASAGGFTAAVSVTSRGVRPEDELAEPVLADGFRFKDPRAALRYAFDVGHRHVRQKFSHPLD